MAVKTTTSDKAAKSASKVLKDGGKKNKTTGVSALSDSAKGKSKTAKVKGEGKVAKAKAAVKGKGKAVKAKAK